MNGFAEEEHIKDQKIPTGRKKSTAIIWLHKLYLGRGHLEKGNNYFGIIVMRCF